MFEKFKTQVNQWDLLLFMRVFEMSGKKIFDRSMFWISRSGDGYLYLTAIPLLLFLRPIDGKMIVISGTIGAIIERCTYSAIKRFVKRSRPFETIEGVDFLIHPPDKFSFPSGHTAGAFLMTTIIGGTYATMKTPLLMWASAVGFSRVYLGVHYPSDVLAGTMLGIASAKIGKFLVISR